jgi:hypothetical protein
MNEILYRGVPGYLGKTAGPPNKAARRTLICNVVYLNLRHTPCIAGLSIMYYKFRHKSEFLQGAVSYGWLYRSSCRLRAEPRCLHRRARDFGAASHCASSYSSPAPKISVAAARNRLMIGSSKVNPHYEAIPPLSKPPLSSRVQRPCKPVPCLMVLLLPRLRQLLAVLLTQYRSLFAILIAMPSSRLSLQWSFPCPSCHRDGITIGSLPYAVCLRRLILQYLAII